MIQVELDEFVRLGGPACVDKLIGGTLLHTGHATNETGVNRKKSIMLSKAEGEAVLKSMGSQPPGTGSVGSTGSAKVAPMGQ